MKWFSKIADDTELYLLFVLVLTAFKHNKNANVNTSPRPCKYSFLLSHFRLHCFGSSHAPKPRIHPRDVSPLCACFTRFYHKDRRLVTKFCLKTTRNVQYDEKRRFKLSSNWQILWLKALHSVLLFSVKFIRLNVIEWSILSKSRKNKRIHF